MLEYEKGADTLDSITEKLNFVKDNSALLPLDANLAELSGTIYHNMRKNMKDWPIADAVVLASAQSCNAKVLTGDPHFKSMENVIFLR